jgi:AraC family transcriptional regulator
LDDSKLPEAEGHTHTGAVAIHRRFGGARVSRIMHPPHQNIAAHGHDWPVITLYRIGGYREQGEHGEAVFDGPSVVLQPAGAAHADVIGPEGLETLSMSFDPAWLKAPLPARTCWRQGGALGAASRRIAMLWLAGDEPAVRAATAALVRAMDEAPERAPRPAWAERVERALADETPTSVIASSLGLNGAWLARAYRAWRGEGMSEALRRRRVERATLALRETSEPLARIAAACGFADQSHMNRAFRAVLARTPLDVRREAAMLAPLARAA